MSKSTESKKQPPIESEDTSQDDESHQNTNNVNNIANKKGDNNTFKAFANVVRSLEQQKIFTEKWTKAPPAIKRRIKALKKLQFESIEIEAKFYEEVHQLECKYHQKYVPLFDKRNQIVNGVYEPNDEEATWPSDDEEEAAEGAVEDPAKQVDKLSEKIEQNVKVKADEESGDDSPKIDTKGIPNFWLTIFQNVPLLSDMIETTDEPILTHLKDITIDCKEDPMGFVINFHFEPNQFFTNSVLTKEYFMSCKPEDDQPLMFEGPEIYKCKGCPINWNKGMNVTLKTIKKRQKHKNRGVVRTITKTVQNDSFFNFFNPPEVPEKEGGNQDDLEDVDFEMRHLLTSDFEIGHYIRERIVPRAVLYYTGQAVEVEEDDDEESDEDYDEDEESDEEEDEEGGRGGVGDKKCNQQ